MNFLSLIERKREGQALTGSQLREIIQVYTAAGIPDYQMAAFLMAVYFRGLDDLETRALTLAMRDSGEVLAFPDDPRPLVDKHSTGGVGDKVSLVLAPLLASLDCRVPMISGRGLGITGGTLDKLESIPGFKTGLPRAKIIQVVQEVGCVICGQTDTMVPADKRLYALRDVTATVPSIPLIVASILSKKLAENIGALILDVKFGRAAFMTDREEARRLARSMVGLGNDCGVKTRALLSNMDVPVGRSAGNWLEVKEAVQLLEHGREPEDCPDLLDLVVTCSAHLLVLAGKAGLLSAAKAQARQCLASGKPLQKWNEMLRAQGADLEKFQRELEKDSRAAVVREVLAQRDGFVVSCDARIIGEVVRDLGAGRVTKESLIDFDTGLDRIAKPGETVREGAVLACIHASNAAAAERAASRILPAFQIADQPSPVQPLITELIEA